VDLFLGAAPVLDDTPTEDAERTGQARLLLTQMRDGTRNSLSQTVEGNTRFYILGLSPNASRLSVRLWIEADARELEKTLTLHIQDLELKGARDDRPLSVRTLAAATGRYDPKGKARFDTTNVSPHLAGELARSVLTGAPYPQSFLATMVRRIRNDAYVGHERVSAIKACLVRSARLRHTDSKHQEVPVELDQQVTDVAYRCGRLFALLEKTQSDSAGGELNSTIKDRYFSSASATPALVFPRLFRLSNHHLAKLPIGQKIFYERQMSSAMAAPFAFPRQFSLADQGQFIVGYFQQRQDLYTKNEKAPEENA
jgi:CRISPR-associated protein Csd1